VAEIEENDLIYRFVDYANEEKWGFDWANNLFNYCFAKDKKHAIKVTNELRIRLIAEDTWGKVS